MQSFRSGRRFVRAFSFYLLVIIVLVLLLFPFYWMIVTSFKSEGEIFSLDKAPLWVWHPTFANYRQLLKTPLYGRWFLNSAIVSLITTAGSVFLSVLAGYAVARLRFAAATVLGTLIFLTYLVPRTLLFIPVAQVMNQLHVLGSPAALLLSYPTFLIPFCTWLLIGYFRTIPIDLEECAMVDGCTRLQAVRKITLPLAVPGVLTAAIFAFTFAWNELLYPLVLVSGNANKTLPLGVVSTLTKSDYFFWGPLMAASTLASIPVAILFFFFMDLYVSGLTAGAVKG